MSESRESRIKRLLYQSWYRGCKETDRILGAFARKHLESFSEVEISAFEAILAENDRDLFNWLTGVEKLPQCFRKCTVMRQLMAFKCHI